MARNADSTGRFGLRDVPGTTIAVVALGLLGAAAIVSAPLAVWYWRKRKRADALAAQPTAAVAEPDADPASQGSGQPQTSEQSTALAPQPEDRSGF